MGVIREPKTSTVLPVRLLQRRGRGKITLIIFPLPPDVQAVIGKSLRQESVRIVPVSVWASHEAHRYWQYALVKVHPKNVEGAQDIVRERRWAPESHLGQLADPNFIQHAVFLLLLRGITNVISRTKTLPFH